MPAQARKGVCSACGAPWVRQVERDVSFESGSGKAGNIPDGKHKGGVQAESGDYDIRMGPVVHSTTLGWHPSCICEADIKPAVCLKILSAASGTVALVAQRLGRKAICIEISPEYAHLAQELVRARASQ